jgi:hypothetical protein
LSTSNSGTWGLQSDTTVIQTVHMDACKLSNICKLRVWSSLEVEAADIILTGEMQVGCTKWEIWRLVMEVAGEVGVVVVMIVGVGVVAATAAAVVVVVVVVMMMVMGGGDGWWLMMHVVVGVAAK